MSILGAAGQSPGLHQLLQTLSTSGTSPSRPVDPTSSIENRLAVESTVSGEGAAGPPPSLVKQISSTIRTTVNTLWSNHTGNPHDVLQSIEQSLQKTLSGNGVDPNWLSQNANPVSSPTPGLDSLLGRSNIDPGEFRNNLVAALPATQNGTPDFDQIFHSFPPGTHLDLVA
jgi:hypothetical protein